MYPALPLHILTLNVRGLGSRRKQFQLLRLFEEEKVDVAAIQETKLSTDEGIAGALEPFLKDYEICVSQYTHFQGTSHARLDRIYVSGDIINSMSNYQVKPVFFSDHCLVSVCFGPRRLRGVHQQWEHWKLNLRLLSDEQFSTNISLLLSNTLQNIDMHIFAKWDSFKQEAKNLAIERATRATIASYINKQQQRDLFKNLVTLYELECLNPGAYSDDVNIVRAQLQKYETERYRGALIRSRKKRLLLGEQPTKRSLDDERRNALSKEIVEINKDGNIVCGLVSFVRVAAADESQHHDASGFV
ncbi:uncharacterized protein LOC120837149 [Ixodes scapularis]|uniref:uncharacterized protein LOC120837149 n=1 Tax=Ixodes scapularis TaxID=6945 RepID=UPI001A9CF11B|nr:uncharacterized protein LOC120837149 [Ixodes scapularis]